MWPSYGPQRMSFLQSTISLTRSVRTISTSSLESSGLQATALQRQSISWVVPFSKCPCKKAVNPLSFTMLGLKQLLIFAFSIGSEDLRVAGTACHYEFQSMSSFFSIFSILIFNITIIKRAIHLQMLTSRATLLTDFINVLQSIFCPHFFPCSSKPCLQYSLVQISKIFNQHISHNIFAKMSNIQFELQRLQNEIEEEVSKYNALDKKSQQYIQSRTSLFQQESENSLVLNEIEMLPEDAKIYKQVGGVLIDQKKKEVKTTLSNRIGLIKSQIENTNELLKKNEKEQKNEAEKIQKAKERYYEMAQSLQGNQ